MSQLVQLLRKTRLVPHSCARVVLGATIRKRGVLQTIVGAATPFCGYPNGRRVLLAVGLGGFAAPGFARPAFGRAA